MLLVCFQRTIVACLDRFKQSGSDGSLIGRGECDVGGPPHGGSQVGGSEHQARACFRMTGRGAQCHRRSRTFTGSLSFIWWGSVCFRVI